MGAAFSSIGFAVGAIFLVDIPLVLGLIGNGSRQILFPVLGLLGSSTVIVWVVSIYAHDIAGGLTPTSFFYEGWSWLYFGINAIHIFLTAMKIKQMRSKIGVPSP
jgi:hypothetical protein